MTSSPPAHSTRRRRDARLRLRDEEAPRRPGQGRDLVISGRRIGRDAPTYIVAEMSANHGGRYDAAVRIVEAAKEVGADAVKLQTYTPDTMTINCATDPFRIHGTIWHGRSLYELYGEACTPWEWQPKLQEIAHRLGLGFFSTPFDPSAVEFLERLQVPVYKIASFENVDLPLLRQVARTGKPIILSTGMARYDEIEEALHTIHQAGGAEVALLKCTSAYPAPPRDMHLRTIPDMARAFGVPVGFSDHTLEHAVPLAAVALGACIVEKHLTLSRKANTPDSAFSLEPHEFKAMVQAIRTLEQAMGSVAYGPSEAEATSLAFRRSLFVVKDVAAGELLTMENVRSIRPGDGLHTRHLEDVLGRRARRAIARGTPLTWELVER